MSPQKPDVDAGQSVDENMRTTLCSMESSKRIFEPGDEGELGSPLLRELELDVKRQ
jgi:hypothetical protein